MKSNCFLLTDSCCNDDFSKLPLVVIRLMPYHPFLASDTVKPIARGRHFRHEMIPYDIYDVPPVTKEGYWLRA